MTEKSSEHRLKKEMFICVKNIVRTKNWFDVSIFWTPYGKNILAICMSYKDKFHSFQNFSFTKYFRTAWSNKLIFSIEATSVSLFLGGMLPNWLKTLL